MPEPRIEQLFLVPGKTKADAAVWGAAVAEYAAAFPGVYISNDYRLALQPNFERITIVDSDDWHEEMWLFLRQNPRRFILETLVAPTPEVLADLLHVRVYHGLRFGFQTEFDWKPLWNYNICLIGLHGRSDGEMQEADVRLVRDSRMEAVKLTSHATHLSVRTMYRFNPGLFVMLRPIMRFHDDNRPRTISPAQFVAETTSDLQRMFDENPNIQYIEVHNEPNLTIEGLGGYWKNGVEFANWFNETVRLFRQRWPDKKYGFPGLSPGPAISGLRQELKQFLAQAAGAATRADWVGVHAYWTSEYEMTAPEGGFIWRLYRQYFHDKLLFITEFGNPVQPKDIVANQYARYYGMLRHVGGLGGAFAYVASTSNSEESPRWGWRDEMGNDFGIAKEIGLRKFIR